MFVVVAIGVVIAISLTTNSNTSETLLSNAQQRQLELNKTGAVVIGQFLNLSAKSLSLMHKFDYELTCDPVSCHQTLIDFTKRWEDSPIVGIAMVDKNGIVIDNYNFAGVNAVGQDLSDREYLKIAQSLEIGQVHTSEPVISRLGSTQGKYILTLSTPLSENGTYSGALIVPVLIEDFITRYFSFTQNGQSQIYLVDSDGTILIASQDHRQKVSAFIGKNLFEVINENPFFDSEAVAMELNEMINSPEPQSTQLVLPNSFDGQIKKSLVTSAPVKSSDDGQGTWTLLMITPAESILSYLAPLYIQQITWLTIIFFVLLFFVMSMMKLIEIKEHDSGVQKQRVK